MTFYVHAWQWGGFKIVLWVKVGLDENFVKIDEGILEIMKEMQVSRKCDRHMDIIHTDIWTSR